MENIAYCPSAGQMYIMMIISIILTTLVISIIYYNYEHNGPDDFFKTGIIIGALSFVSFLYLVKVDLYDLCGIYDNNKCKNSKNAIKNNAGDCRIIFKQNYIYLFIYLVCSVYLLVYGIIHLKKSYKNENHTNVIIASLIFGAIGSLYVFNELIFSRILILFSV